MCVGVAVDVGGVLVRRVKEEKAEYKLLEQSYFKTTCYWSGKAGEQKELGPLWVN